MINRISVVALVLVVLLGLLPAQIAFAQAYPPFGVDGDRLVPGDWNGDGLVESGLFHAGYFYRDTNTNGVFDNGDVGCVFGEAGDIPLSGDWDHDGFFEVGVIHSGVTYYDDDCPHQVTVIATPLPEERVVLAAASPTETIDDVVEAVSDTPASITPVTASVDAVIPHDQKILSAALPAEPRMTSSASDDDTTIVTTVPLLPVTPTPDPVGGSGTIDLYNPTDLQSLYAALRAAPTLDVWEFVKGVSGWTAGGEIRQDVNAGDWGQAATDTALFAVGLIPADRIISALKVGGVLADGRALIYQVIRATDLKAIGYESYDNTFRAGAGVLSTQWSLDVNQVVRDAARDKNLVVLEMAVPAKSLKYVDGSMVEVSDDALKSSAASRISDNEYKLQSIIFQQPDEADHYIRQINTFRGTSDGRFNCIKSAMAMDAITAGRPASALGTGIPVTWEAYATEMERIYGSRFVETNGLLAADLGAVLTFNGERMIAFEQQITGIWHAFNVYKDEAGVVHYVDAYRGREVNLDLIKGPLTYIITNNPMLSVKSAPVATPAPPATAKPIPTLVERLMPLPTRIPVQATAKKLAAEVTSKFTGESVTSNKAILVSGVTKAFTGKSPQAAAAILAASVSSKFTTRVKQQPAPKAVRPAPLNLSTVPKSAPVKPVCLSRVGCR